MLLTMQLFLTHIYIYTTIFFNVLTKNFFLIHFLNCFVQIYFEVQIYSYFNGKMKNVRLLETFFVLLL